MGKRSKRDEILSYAYHFLYKDWATLNKKLGVDKDAFIKPKIKLVRRSSEYNSSSPDLIGINYQTALNAYDKKNEKINGLEIKYEHILRDDIIHECVHYIQDEFYNVHDDNYGYMTEGLASLVTIEVHLANKAYKIAANSVLEYFVEMKREYADYFGLPKKYNKHIEKIINEGPYEPVERDIAYAKGFMYICEEIGRSGNYLHLLIDPFKNSEVAED